MLRAQRRVPGPDSAQRWGAGDIREVGPKEVTLKLRLGVETIKTEEKLCKVQSLEPVGHV